MASEIVAAETTPGPSRERELTSGCAEYRGIVAASATMGRLFDTLAKLESSLCSVLIEGESGVGKERVAQALHQGSTVRAGPFVAINCGALPRELIASELFGHRKGAFSGAFEARRGAFESADGGTLLLDEIGELPLDVQPMLLRALEIGEVRALGDDQVKRIDVRVLAATNRDLEADVRAGRFRSDLLYRLAVVRLEVLPLRERPEDIAPLARRFAVEAGVGPLPHDVIAELETRRWPGNARELRNAITTYAALGSLPTKRDLSPGDLEQLLAGFVDPARSFLEQKDELTEAFTRIYLATLLERTGHNQSEAARVSQLNRNYLARLMVKHRVSRPGK